MLSNIYSLLTPFIILMIAMEMAYCFLFKRNYISYADAVTNMGTAIGNQCVNIFVAMLVLWSYGFLHEIAPFKIETTLISFIFLLIGFDFFFYWFHRFGHSFNILWAAHMPHHTSQEMNLFVALRASITQRLFSFLFVWPLALMGFAPDAIYAASAVQLVIAFWHHTKVIKKMGWFEVVFNSPSHHRVHHGVNKEYLDKNFGEIFIIWDKWFGTFTPEKEEVVFGALTPPRTCNPNKIYFQYWHFLLKDAWNTKHWWDKVRVWFMPLGWRPRDLRSNPRKLIWAEDQIPYQPLVTTDVKVYLFFQIILGLIFMGFTINLENNLIITDRIMLTGIIWLMITSWGAILEGQKWSTFLELTRLVLSLGAIKYFKAPWPESYVNIFLALSIVGILWIHFKPQPALSK